MAKTVLIIGGTRFLGEAITRAFVEQGDQVWLMNRGTRSSPCDEVESVACDKTDRTAFGAVLNRRDWDIIVDTILDDKDLLFAIDTLKTKVGMFIHTGSLGVYGATRRLPASESEPLCEHTGECVVFNHKLRQDQVLMRAFHEKAFPGVVLRQSYIYGAGDIPLDGWGGRSAVFFRRMRDGESLMLPGDGRALLHPGHVRDLARAYTCAALNPRSVGQIYNVGGPFALTMMDYMKELAAATGVEPRFVFTSPNEILKQFPDEVDKTGLLFSTQHMMATTAKIERELGWRSNISLAEGLRENIAWMRREGHI